MIAASFRKLPTNTIEALEYQPPLEEDEEIPPQISFKRIAGETFTTRTYSVPGDGWRDEPSILTDQRPAVSSLRCHAVHMHEQPV